jgi:hypothetical protein
MVNTHTNKEVEMTETHLFSNCPVTCSGDCAEVVKQAPTGRWFITIGHAGFNTRANNGSGYATEEAARAENRRLQGRGLRSAEPKLDRKVRVIAVIYRNGSRRERVIHLPLEKILPAFGDWSRYRYEKNAFDWVSRRRFQITQIVESGSFTPIVNIAFTRNLTPYKVRCKRCGQEYVSNQSTWMRRHVRNHITAELNEEQRAR